VGGRELPQLVLLEFAEPLIEAAPFHSTIAARLRADDVVLVQPCFREHLAWMRELHVDLLQHQSFKRGFRMSLGCFSDGCGEYVENPQAPPPPPPMACQLHVSPRMSASSVFDFLEAQWQHLVAEPGSIGADADAPTPPAGTVDRVYLKDLSQQHDIRSHSSSSLGTADAPALLLSQVGPRPRQV